MSSTKTLKRWSPGQSISAKQLNEAVDEVNRINRGVDAPKQRIPDSKLSSPVSIRQFKIVSVEADHLVCKTFNGTSQGTELFNVAKPPRLRNEDSWNDLTFTYTSTTERDANDGIDSETQVVVPAYAVGDIIYATKSVKGGTSTTFDNNGAEEKIEWLDDNRDARAWSKKSE